MSAAQFRPRKRPITRDGESFARDSDAVQNGKEGQRSGDERGRSKTRRIGGGRGQMRERWTVIRQRIKNKGESEWISFGIKNAASLCQSCSKRAACVHPACSMDNNHMVGMVVVVIKK